jgi:hypothetical protein
MVKLNGHSEDTKDLFEIFNDDKVDQFETDLMKSKKAMINARVKFEIK